MEQTNQTPVCEILETKTKNETKPAKTKPPIQVIKQKLNIEIMNKATPETKTKPAKTYRQRKKTKPKVVETSELKLFLEKRGGKGK